MNHDTTRTRISRIIGTGLVLLVPLLGHGSTDFIIAIAATLTAYEGLRKGTVYGVLCLLVIIEVMYGMDVGVLSLSYVIAVSVLALAGRVIAITPWTASTGWHASDALRVFLIACGVFFVLVTSTVLLGNLLYGYGDMRARLQFIYTVRTITWAPFGIAVLLIMLRRIDEPFHRRILFGT